MDFITKAQLFAQDHFIVIAIVASSPSSLCARSSSHVTTAVQPANMTHCAQNHSACRQTRRKQ